MNDGTPSGLSFGIYPGGAIGNTEFRPLPDQPDKINQALDELQGSPDRPFAVRAYDVYADPGNTVHATTLQAPAGYDRYLGHGRTLDLVAQYHSRSGDIEGYCGFIENLIDRHGASLATLQIAEEPNITGDPNLDGFYPRVTEALIAGVRAAKHKAHSGGHPALKVGCNTSPRLPSAPPSRASYKPTAATTSPRRGSPTFPWSSRNTAGPPGRPGPSSARPRCCAPSST